MEDRTVSIPTPVSNEEALRQQEEQRKQRETAVRATGGGCVAVILPFVMAAISAAAWVVC